MNTRKRSEIEEDTDAASSTRSESRFAYHGDDDPGEGGVHSTTKKTANGRTAGAPGPEERRLDISELARTVGMRYTHHFDIPPRSAEGDFQPETPLVGKITLTNTGAILLLRGDVKTDLRLECARCLEPTVQPVETDLEEEFDLVSTNNNAFRQDEVQVVDEDTPAAVIAANVLDLGELLRQNLLLAAPLQPLCREDCPGIDLSGHAGVRLIREAEAAAAAAAAAEEAATAAEELAARDNPLKHLAEMLEARRRQEEENASS